jgi:integrase/recombinase XerD
MIALPLEDIAPPFPDQASDFAEPAIGASDFLSSWERLHPAHSDPDLRPVEAFLTGGSADAAAIPWGELRRQDVLAVRAWVLEAFSGPPAARIMAALGRVMTNAGSPAAEVLARGLYTVRSRRAGGSGRRLRRRELWAVLDACLSDPSPCGSRDAAIISLLGFAGLLPSEISRLESGAYDDQLETLRLPKTARAPVARIVALDGVAAAALGTWLASRGPGNGPMFVPLRRGAPAVLSAGLGPTAINSILRKRAARAGGAALRPADLRASYLATLRDEVRQSSFAYPARFGLGEDGEALVITASLRILPPPGLSTPGDHDPGEVA